MVGLKNHFYHEYLQFMALSKSEVRVLRELLDSFDEKIFDRGEELFDQDHVRFLSLDIPSKTYAFSVQGSGGYAYRVDICLDQALIEYGYDIGADFESSCECVYYEENLTCKHVAAAALFLDYHDEEDFPIREQAFLPKPSRLR